MIRLFSRLSWGLVLGALGLGLGGSDVSTLALDMSLPGLVALLQLAFIVVLLGAALARVRWMRLAKGDLVNFLPRLSYSLASKSAIFVGLSTFAGVQWIMAPSGCGLKLSLLACVVALTTGWLAYCADALFTHYADEIE